MTPHPVTVYRHRTWHPTPSQYTDTAHDTPPCHSIQTQGITPPRHSIQTQHMIPHPVTVYTQDMKPTPVTLCRHRTDMGCTAGIHRSIPVSMFLILPNPVIFSRPSAHVATA